MKYHDQEIEALHKRGYQVKQLTPYQFRIECVIDLYPKRRRFHNIANQKRGGYPFYPVVKLEKLLAFVDEQIKAADEILDRAIKSGQLDELSGCSEPGERRRWLNENNQPWFVKFSKQVSA